MTDVHFINRLPSKTLDLLSPINILANLHPSVRLKTDLSVKIFECVTYVHNPTYKRNKWSHKALKCVFFGYSTTQKGYKVYHPITRKYIVSKDVLFDEKTLYYASDKTTRFRDLPYLQLLSNSTSSSTHSTDDQTDHQHLSPQEFSVKDEDSQSFNDISHQVLGHHEIVPLEPITQEQINLPTYPKHYERRKKSSVLPKAQDDHKRNNLREGECCYRKREYHHQKEQN